MKFYSTNDSRHRVDLRRAVTEGLAPDGGLYMPEEIPALPASVIKSLSAVSAEELFLEAALIWLKEDFSKADVHDIVEKVFTFPVPLVRIDSSTFALELFHGPTLAFKDFGARFLSQLVTRFVDREITVLVATSGDTGSAVASAFLGVPQTRVYVLYPQGGVSEVQEKQLTTFGGNVRAFEVRGTFDDCQRLVKSAFQDQELKKKYFLTSANSINVGRLIPQSFYYLVGASQLPSDSEKPIVAVPSGNLGNLTSGLFAQEMGLPIRFFMAATNANDVLPHYLNSGQFSPRPSKKTFSNAMDVGNPSNFARLNALFGGKREAMTENIRSLSVSDDETLEMIHECLEETGYVLDPHGAVALKALRKLNLETNAPKIFLATAHPAKFGDIVKPIAGDKLVIPKILQECLEKRKESIEISSDFSEFRAVIETI